MKKKTWVLNTNVDKLMDKFRKSKIYDEILFDIFFRYRIELD